MNSTVEPRVVERVQTGVRIEKRILKVVRGLAEYLDMNIGDLLEGVLLHSFEGTPPFGEETLARIRMLKELYGLELSAADAHHLLERARRKPSLNLEPGTPAPKARAKRNK